MTPQVQIEPTASEIHWNSPLRVAFRFCFVYFGLYCLTGQPLAGLIPIVGFLVSLGVAALVRQPVFWLAAHVFHAELPLVYMGSGSGDKTFDWTLAFCDLILAALATIILSILDRKRENYVTLHKWFRVFIRFALASQMIVYGISKAVPMQMPFPGLAQLVEPFGNFSPMGVLWSSIGASPAYEIFTGCAELLGGILLVIPCTALLGALVCLADTVEVFTLNMTYDVPVKLLSFHLLLMSLFLLAPELRRLSAFFFLNREVKPSSSPPLFATPRANRIALLAQLCIGLWLIGMNVFGAWLGWHFSGGGTSKSPLYGIWNVEEMSIDAELRPPLVTDNGRWRRVIFDRPTQVAFQGMDGASFYYAAEIHPDIKTIALTRTKETLKFERPAQDQLTLDGIMGGRKIHMRLQLMDRDKFQLISRGFHWVQEYPFNR